MSSAGRRSFAAVSFILFLAWALWLGWPGSNSNHGEAMSPPLEKNQVRSVTWLMDKAGRLDWAADPKGRIAFDSRGPDGYYDVYVAEANGSNRVCLTCDRAGQVPQKHNGNPAWHPSGRFLVFQAEKAVHPADSSASSPGAGLWCDLWLVTDDGKKFYQLTDLPADQAQGVLHPHFSHDGKKVLWSERIRGFRQAENFGEWAIKVADFSFEGEPRLTNVRAFQPGERRMWYETHGFSPDDRLILFAGDVQQGQTIEGMDVCTFDPASGKLTNLTSSRESWDEHAHFSPGGDRIAWMSSQGLPGRGTIPWAEYMKWLSTELWIMNPDGSNKQRVTHFNEPGHPMYSGGRAIVGDGDFSKDGKKYAVLVNVMKPGSWEERLALVEFE